MREDDGESRKKPRAGGGGRGEGLVGRQTGKARGDTCQQGCRCGAQSSSDPISAFQGLARHDTCLSDAGAASQTACRAAQSVTILDFAIYAT